MQVAGNMIWKRTSLLNSFQQFDFGQYCGRHLAQDGQKSYAKIKSRVDFQSPRGNELICWHAVRAPVHEIEARVSSLLFSRAIVTIPCVKVICLISSSSLSLPLSLPLDYEYISIYYEYIIS